MKIILAPSQKLRKISTEVQIIDKKMRKLMGNMIKQIKNNKGEVGLAAPQVGKNYRLFVLKKFDEEARREILLMINPKIIKGSDNWKLEDEGCLSVPDVFGQVYRDQEIIVEYQDDKFKKHVLKLTDFNAVIFQHELDHLDGILFIDKVKIFYLEDRFKRGQKPKVVFFGSSPFSVSILASLIKNKEIEIVGVITNQDKPVGRKQIMTANVVTEFAEANGLKLFKIDQLNDKYFFEELKSLEWDLAITASFGKILSQKIIDIFYYGIINVHTSLLPLYRGASPIISALVNGDIETGVSLQKIKLGLDKGDIIAQEKVKIEEQETVVELEEKLAKKGAKLLNEKIMPYLSGDIFLEEQLDKASYCGKFTAKDGVISFQKDSLKDIINKSRAFKGKIKLRLKNEEIFFDKKKIIIEDLILSLVKGVEQLQEANNAKIGDLIVKNKQVYLKVKSGWLILEKVQLPGKKKMDSISWVNGYLK